MKTLNLSFITLNNKKSSLKFVNPNPALTKEDVEQAMHELTELALFVKDKDTLYHKANHAKYITTDTASIF